MVGEFLTLLFIAVAISLDAFSVSLGMGFFSLRKREILKIGVVVGLFHIIMPLGGLFIGQVISMKLGMLATMLGGILLVGIGAHLLFSTFKEKEKEKASSLYGVGLLLFAMSVSVDSFSAGLSLGMFGARTGLTILLFGIMSMVFTWGGLLLGKKVKGIVGIYGELIGGFILILFGLKLLFVIVR